MIDGPYFPSHRKRPEMFSDNDSSIEPDGLSLQDFRQVGEGLVAQLQARGGGGGSGTILEPKSGTKLVPAKEATFKLAENIGSPGRSRTCDFLIDRRGPAHHRPSVFLRACA
jgi:hypothetical protein